MTTVKPVRVARKPPKKKPQKRVWRVEATVPNGAGNFGGTNLNCDVVAYTLEGAIEALRAEHPTAVLHKVMVDRFVKDVYFSKEKAPVV